MKNFFRSNKNKTAVAGNADDGSTVNTPGTAYNVNLDIRSSFPPGDHFTYTILYVDDGFTFTVKPHSDTHKEKITRINGFANPENIKDIFEHGTIDDKGNIGLGYMSGFLNENFIIFLNNMVRETYGMDTV